MNHNLTPAEITKLRTIYENDGYHEWPDDSTLATKGIVAGVCLSVPIWIVLGAVVWAVW